MALFKRTVFLFFYCICSVIACYSQDSNNIFFKGLRTDYSPTSYFRPQIPFKVKSVTVKDNRCDTLCLGLFKDSYQNNVRLQLKPGQKLHNFFDFYLRSDTAQVELYLVINHLFISNNIYKKPDSKKQRKPASRYTGILTFKAKAYILQAGYYQGLIKIDTTFVIDKVVEKTYDALLEDVLYTTSYLIGQSITAGSFVNHPKMSKARLDSINIPFNFPASTNETDSGYYASYADLIQGNLTSTNFELDKLQEGCYCVYTIDKDGIKTLERDIWGIKKGNTTYIMDDGLLFPIIKNDNAWYWKGLFKYVQKHAFMPIVLPVGGGLLYGVDQLDTHIKLDYVPCLLNTETGTRY